MNPPAVIPVQALARAAVKLPPPGARLPGVEFLAEVVHRLRGELPRDAVLLAECVDLDLGAEGRGEALGGGPREVSVVVIVAWSMQTSCH